MRDPSDPLLECTTFAAVLKRDYFIRCFHKHMRDFSDPPFSLSSYEVKRFHFHNFANNVLFYVGLDDSFPTQKLL